MEGVPAPTSSSLLSVDIEGSAGGGAVVTTAWMTGFVDVRGNLPLPFLVFSSFGFLVVN